jgi:itaconyl-CoA hydratase
MSKILSRLEQIGDQRYRESHGLYYEDFDIDDIYEHRPGRTITETDNIWLSLICMNTHPLHINNDYAAATEFKKPLVSSLITFAIVGGLSLAATSARGIANLGWNNIKFISPVFVGDSIYAETRIISKRLSNSRKNQGIVTVQTTGLKDNMEIFMTCERSFLVPCKGNE